MLQFVPFDDRWFDAGELPPGPLVPYHVGVACAHVGETTDLGYCVAGGMPVKVAVSPSRTSSFAAVPAFSSST